MKRTVHVLPFDVSKDDEFYDLILGEKTICVYGCFSHRIIDLDYEDTYLFAYEIKENAELELKDKLSVVIIYDDFDETSVAVERNKNGDINGMRFPLFAHYLYNWLEGERCLFTQAGNVCFFSKDFEGLIIAEPYTGEVHKLIALPEKYLQTSKKYKCFYNEHTGILSIVSVEGVEQYKVCDSVSASGNEIEILNQKYNDACEKNINLQKHPSGYLFKRAFYRAIEAVVVEKI